MQHVGTYIFGGSLADLASIGASATADPGALKKKNPQQTDSVENARQGKLEAKYL